MKKMKLGEIIQAVNGQPVNCNADAFIFGISSRINFIAKGFLFIPLVGNQPVTAELIDSAYVKGAVAAVVPNEVKSKLPQIIVPHTVKAYGSIFKYYRNKFNIPVIAVTGSAGKTSTKDMLALILGKKYNVCKTAGNDNDYVGVYRTIYKMNDTHKVAVFEIGFNGYFGNIGYMADIVRPNISVITNISTGHMGVLGSKEKIMKAKMELTSYFNKDSILVINNDDENLCTIKDRPYRIIRVSMQGKGDYNAYDIVDKGEDGVEFKCKLNDVAHLFKLNVPGVHFIYSALIGIAVGELLAVDVEQIKEAIESFTPLFLRMNILNLNKNIKIINDCYNANLASMKSAIDVLKSFKGDRKIAVLGDILEQGKCSEKIHREVGKYLINKCDILIAVGDNSRFIYEETKDLISSSYFKTKEEACLYLSTLVKENDVILVKGSRGMNMEQVAEYLTEKTKGK